MRGDAKRAQVAAVILVLAAATAAGALAVGRWWPLVLAQHQDRALPGARVEGVALLAGEAARPQIDALVAELEGHRLRLVDPGHENGAPVLEATLADLGVRVDADAVERRALRLGRRGGAWARAEAADRARRGEIDVPLDPSIDARAVVALLAPLKEALDAHATAARLDLDGHRIVPERDGRALDLDAAVAAVLRAARAHADAVPLPFVTVRSPVTGEALSRIDVRRTLASFDTYLSRAGDQAPRARNIEVAAAHLDGLVVAPGALASFNDVVGARSEENGFVKAFEIFKGEFVEGRGGGTCQVASTFHAAAFYAGMDIVERLPHSRPSPYIPAGLDATVAYPTVDLKIRNPFAFPVVFRARVAQNALRVEVLGADKPVSVELQKEILSTTPFDRKVVEDPAIDQPKRKQKGSEGMELRRSRTLAYRTGAFKVETSVDRYPPTQEVWKVPPGYDESLLPPLGEDPDASAPDAAPSETAPDPATPHEAPRI